MPGAAVGRGEDCPPWPVMFYSSGTNYAFGVIISDRTNKKK